MTPGHPLISICIPCYKRTVPLRRLLGSISKQTYRNFEVVVTDDSPDDSVKEVCAEFSSLFTLIYQKNGTPKGTPDNWNEAVAIASGVWIKIMHDDDWFLSENSLERFQAAITAADNKHFIFCAYQNIREETLEISGISYPSSTALSGLRKSPFILMAKNHIGPPSCTLYRRNNSILFDESLKWLVDLDFYIRYLLENPGIHYVNEPLVNIGLSESQVTQQVFGDPNVVVPEYFNILNKFGSWRLKDLRIYDAYWRMFRNLKVNTATGIKEAGYCGNVPQVILQMLPFQRLMPFSLLKIGVFSKLMMLTSYFFWMIRGKGTQQSNAL